MRSWPQITVTRDARDWIIARGGVVTITYSPRHGCCGGTAAVPEIRTGPPDQGSRGPAMLEDSSIAQGIEVDGIVVHLPVPATFGCRRNETIHIALEGFLGWNRLRVDGLPLKAG